MIPEQWRAEVYCAVAILACIFVMGFSIVNWADHVPPIAPYPIAGENQDQYTLRMVAHQRKMDEVGKTAVIPLMVAVPLTFVAVGGIVFFIVVLIIRHNN